MRQTLRDPFRTDCRYRTAIPLLRVRLRDQHLRRQHSQGGCSSSLAKARCDWRSRRRCFVLAWVTPSAPLAACLGSERCPQASTRGVDALSQNRPLGFDKPTSFNCVFGRGEWPRSHATGEERVELAGGRLQHVFRSRVTFKRLPQSTIAKMDRPPKL